MSTFSVPYLSGSLVESRISVTPSLVLILESVSEWDRCRDGRTEDTVTHPRSRHLPSDPTETFSVGTNDTRLDHVLPLLVSSR